MIARVVSGALVGAIPAMVMVLFTIPVSGEVELTLGVIGILLGMLGVVVGAELGASLLKKRSAPK